MTNNHQRVKTELKNKIEVDEVELVLPVSTTANGIKGFTEKFTDNNRVHSRES